MSKYNGDSIWGAKDGKKTKFKDIEDGYLDNIIKYIKRSPSEHDPEVLIFMENMQNERKVSKNKAELKDKIAKLK